MNRSIGFMPIRMRCGNLFILISVDLPFRAIIIFSIAFGFRKKKNKQNIVNPDGEAPVHATVYALFLERSN